MGLYITIGFSIVVIAFIIRENYLYFNDKHPSQIKSKAIIDSITDKATFCKVKFTLITHSSIEWEEGDLYIFRNGIVIESAGVILEYVYTIRDFNFDLPNDMRFYKLSSYKVVPDKIILNLSEYQKLTIKINSEKKLKAIEAALQKYIEL